MKRKELIGVKSGKQLLDLIVRGIHNGDFPAPEPRDPSTVVDRKFVILAVNPSTGKVYTEDDALLLCAKDAAVPAALAAYASECVDRGANPEHIESIELLRERVHDFQQALGGGRIPDTVGAELPRCLRGGGL